MGHSRPLFLLFSSFQYNTVDNKLMFCKNLPMSGFELWTSGIWGDRSANWATTTAPHFIIFCLLIWNRIFVNKCQGRIICIMQEKYSLLTNASEIRGDKVLKVSPSIKSLVSFRAIAEAKIGKSQKPNVQIFKTLSWGFCWLIMAVVRHVRSTQCQFVDPNPKVAHKSTLKSFARWRLVKRRFLAKMCSFCLFLSFSQHTDDIVQNFTIKA